MDLDPVIPNLQINTLAAGISVTLIGRFIGRGLIALSQIILARLLGPAAYGLYSIGLTLLSMVGIVIPAGTEFGVVHFGSRHYQKDNSALKSTLLRALGITLGSGLLWGAFFFFGAPWLALRVFQKPELVPVIQLFSTAIPFVGGLKILAAATRITQRVKFSVYAEEFAQPAINLVLILVFYWVGWKLMGSIAALALAYGLASLLALYYVWKLYGQVIDAPASRIGSLGEMLRFSIPASLSVILTSFLIWTGRLLVGYFLPAADVGVYQSASQISVLLANVLYGFALIAQPMISALYHNQELAELEKLYRTSTKWSLYLSLPIFIVCLAAPGEIIRTLFGSEYIGGIAAFMILVAGQLVYVGVGDVGSLLVMTGHQRQWLVASAGAFTAMVVASVILIPRIGLIGAALANALGMACLTGCGLFFVHRRLRLWPYDRRYLKGLAAALITFLLVFLAIHVPAGDLLRITLTGLLDIFCFFGILRLLGLDDEDRFLLNLLWGRVRAAFGVGP